MDFHFLPRFCFAKRTNINYIPKDAGINISHYLFWHPCNHLLHPHSLNFYQEKKSKNGVPTFFCARKVDIPNNNIGWWRGEEEVKVGRYPNWFPFFPNQILFGEVVNLCCAATCCVVVYVKSKPAAQAVGGDPSRWSSTNGKNPPIKQNHRNFWTSAEMRFGCPSGYRILLILIL